MIAIFRYIPSLRDEWEGSILWVSPEKLVPQVVGHEKGEKLSLAEVFLSPLTNLGMGSTVFTGATGKIFPQGVDHGKAEKLRPGERFFDGCDCRNISSLVKRWEPAFMGVIGEKSSALFGGVHHLLTK